MRLTKARLCEQRVTRCLFLALLKVEKKEPLHQNGVELRGVNPGNLEHPKVLVFLRMLKYTRCTLAGKK